MRSLVIYDSWYDNTREIAEAIAEGLGGEVQVIEADGDPTMFIPECELVVVGSPTHGGVTTPNIQEFLEYLEPDELEGVAVAAFDTRATYRWLKLIGFAAGRVAKQLQQKGGTLVIRPEGFYVKHKTGPLLDGEKKRAKKWAQKVKEKVEEGAFA